MGADTQLIELDRETAAELERRATERGLTVAQLVSELVPIAADADEIAELERRWQAIQAGEATVSHEEVVRWLETWGTPKFQPWNKR
jgi:hypothetical protein